MKNFAKQMGEWMLVRLIGGTAIVIVFTMMSMFIK